MAFGEQMLFGRVVVDLGLRTAEDIAEALRVQAEECSGDGAEHRIGEILVSQGRLTAAQVQQVIDEQRRRIGATRVGPYRLVDKIGQGAMGAVYSAEVLATGAKVAVKVLPGHMSRDPAYLARFRREAKIGIELSHPHIVSTLDFGEVDGISYIAMELVDGGTLADQIDARGAFPEALALDIARDLLEALAYGHGRGLVHRDIKPANILFDGTGCAKLSDFGLAKQVDAKSSFMTREGTALGTPHYVAPEQALGNKDVDVRADLYSLGATLFHVVTGQTPFSGRSAVAVVDQQLNRPLPSPRLINPQLSSGCAAVLGAMMIKDCEQRYAHPSEVLADIAELRQGRPPAIALRRLASVPAPAGAAALAPTVRVPPPDEPAQRPARRSAIAPPPRRRRVHPLGLSWPMIAGVATVLVAVAWLALGGSPAGAPPAGAAPAGGLAPVAAAAPVVHGPSPAAPTSPLPKPAVAPPKPAVAPPAVAAAPSPRTVDLLALIELPRDAVRGVWNWQDGSLIAPVEAGARVQIPYIPPAEYDYTVEFERLSKDDCLTLICALGEGGFFWTMGSYSNKLFAIGEVDGKGQKDSANVKWSQGCLTNGRRYVSTVRVRAGRISALLDGVEITSQATAGHSLAVSPAWLLRDRGRLGLGTWTAPFRIHRIELVEISGPGRPAP